MKKSRRNKMLAAAMLIGAMLCMNGCGSTEEKTEQVEAEDLPATEETDAQAPETEEAGESGQDAEKTAQDGVKGYYFMAGNVVLQTDVEFETVKEGLGEEQSVFEAPSCAGDGKDYIYNYTAYEVETYPGEGGVNKIAYIVLKDDTVATPEGIDLSMTKEDVVAAYGEDYEEVGDQFSYEKDGTKLNFVFEGDNIISIEYASTVIG